MPPHIIDDPHPAAGSPHIGQAGWSAPDSALMKMPVKRTYEVLDTCKTKSVFDHSKARRGYMVGDIAEDPCLNCQRSGPNPHCVIVPGYFSGSCTSCVARRSGTSCSFRTERRDSEPVEEDSIRVEEARPLKRHRMLDAEVPMVQARGQPQNPPAKPPQGNDYFCQCLGQSEVERNNDAKVKTHVSIAAKVNVGSDMVNVFVGEEHQTFAFYKESLRLHSTRFRRMFESDVDEKLHIDCKPTIFADFHAWINSGKFLEIPGTALSASPHPQLDVAELWVLGRFLGAPAFQNWCMDDIRGGCKVDSDHQLPYRSAFDVEHIYKITKKGALLRKFAADVISCDSPFQTLPKDSQELAEWIELLERRPDISIDMLKGAAKNWNGSKPWADEHRDSYMEEEISLDNLWESQMLRTRSREVIEKAANDKCLKSIIELAHLNR